MGKLRVALYNPGIIAVIQICVGLKGLNPAVVPGCESQHIIEERVLLCNLLIQRIMHYPHHLFRVEFGPVHLFQHIKTAGYPVIIPALREPSDRLIKIIFLQIPFPWPALIA